MGYLSRSLWSAGALVLVAGAVGAYAYFGAYRTGLEEQRIKLESIKLFSVDPNEVEGGEVTAKGGIVRFGRSPHGWMIQQPIETLADRYAIQQLLVETLLATSEATVELEVSPEGLGKFGLDPPKVRVVLDLRDGHRAELRLGTKNEFDGRYYAQNPVLPTLGLVDQRVLKGTEKDLYALRDKRVILFDRDQLKALVVHKGPATRFRLERRPDQGWGLIAAGATERADPFEVGRILDALRDLRAQAFVDDSGSSDPALLGRFGLGSPDYRVVLERPEGGDLVLALGQVRGADGVPHSYARVEGGRAIAEVGDLFYRSVDRDPIELVDRRVLDLDPAEIARLTVDGPSGHLELVREGASGEELRWSLKGPSASAASTPRVNALLYALGSLKAQRIDTHDPGPGELRRAGLSPAEWTVAAYDASGEALGTLWVGRTTPSDKGSRFVTRAGSKVIVTARSEDLSALPASAAALTDEPGPSAPAPDASP